MGKLAHASMPREMRRNATRLYNPMKIKELHTLAPMVPWLDYINNILTEDLLQQPRVLQRLPVCSGNQNEPGEEVRGLVMTETMMMMMMMMMMMVTAVMIEEEKQCQASVISMTLPGPSEYIN